MSRIKFLRQENPPTTKNARCRFESQGNQRINRPSKTAVTKPAVARFGCQERLVILLKELSPHRAEDKQFMEAKRFFFGGAKEMSRDVEKHMGVS